MFQAISINHFPPHTWDQGGKTGKKNGHEREREMKKLCNQCLYVRSEIVSYFMQGKF
jgi:hypothetical protein